MKILAIADTESKALWDYFDKSRLEGIDLIISCGDLNPRYLSFLATFTKAPVIYVHGNHDSGYDMQGPDGCECIDDRIFVYRGVRFLGLGGSMRYKPGSYQYTEKEMRKRIFKLGHKIRRRKGFDVLVAHSPAYGIGDASDLPHTGFKCFLPLLDKYRPSYFLHGHVHATYGGDFKREREYGSTHIINAYERYVFEIEDGTCGPTLYERYRRWKWEKFRK